MAASAVPCNHETADAARPRIQSQRLSSHLLTIGVSLLCSTALDDSNAILLKHGTNLLNIIHIHAGNTNTALNLAVTVLNDFELK